MTFTVSWQAHPEVSPVLTPVADKRLGSLFFLLLCPVLPPLATSGSASGLLGLCLPILWELCRSFLGFLIF